MTTASRATSLIGNAIIVWLVMSGGVSIAATRNEPTTNQRP